MAAFDWLTGYAGAFVRAYREGKVGANTVHLPGAGLQVLDASGNLTAPESPQDGAILTSTNRQWLFEEFSGSALDMAEWAIAKQTGDASIAVSGSSLALATGVNAASDVILLSKKKFRIPCRLKAVLFLSQRIADQEFYIDLVAADELAADGTAGGSLAGVGFWGTSATAGYGRYGPAVGEGGFNGDGGGASITTISTASPSVVEIDADIDDVTWNTRSASSPTARTQRLTKVSLIPHPAKEYRLRLRARNIAVPASSTSFYIDNLLVQDHTRTDVEIVGGRGSDDAAQGVPVNARITSPALTSVATNADGQATASSSNNLASIARQQLFNGSTFDRARGNEYVTALASAARTATISSADHTNYNGRGLQVALNVTSAGVGSITLKIEGKDALGGGYYTILEGLAVTANGLYIYKVYPGFVAVANAVANDVVPRVWRVTVTHNNANSISYSVGGCVIL